MLKTIELSNNLALKIFEINNNKVVYGSNRVDKMVKSLFKSKNLKNKKSNNLIYIKAT